MYILVRVPTTNAKSASSYTRSFDAEARRECEGIMDKIYKENPEYWPHGLNIASHDDMYMIREASTNEAVGFTGWQERVRDGKRVGYYTVGVLPEHRNKGYAKAAVAKILCNKAASVDKVQAFIVESNKPSRELAASLGVEVVKSASVASSVTAPSRIAPYIAALLGGAGNATIWDAYHHNGKPFSGEWDMQRAVMTGLNAGLGMGGGSLLHKGFSAGGEAKDALAGVTALAITPGKDLMVAGIPAVNQVRDTAAAAKQQGNTRNAILAAMGILGAGGLAYGAHRVAKAVRRKEDSGRIRLSLPTKDPHDIETQVEIPMEALQLSNNLRGQISRDARRRLRDGGQERTQKRKSAAVNALPAKERVQVLLAYL